MPTLREKYKFCIKILRVFYNCFFNLCVCGTYRSVIAFMLLFTRYVCLFAVLCEVVLICVLFFYSASVHFFCLSKRNEPKKKTPQTPTSIFLLHKACAARLGKIAVRTVRGRLPTKNILESAR